MTSVLQEWVMKLPLREQGTLLTGTRGCDLTPKLPLDSTERQLVAYLRYCFMVPVDDREVGYEPGVFFQTEPPRNWRASELGHYPLHWISHVMHCFEVIAWRHPTSEHRANAWIIYQKIVESLHLMPENRNDMIDRLSEDRIAKGVVVS